MAERGPLDGRRARGRRKACAKYRTAEPEQPLRPARTCAPVGELSARRLNCAVQAVPFTRPLHASPSRPKAVTRMATAGPPSFLDRPEPSVSLRRQAGPAPGAPPGNPTDPRLGRCFQFYAPAGRRHAVVKKALACRKCVCPVYAKGLLHFRCASRDGSARNDVPATTTRPYRCGVASNNDVGCQS